MLAARSCVYFVFQCLRLHRLLFLFYLLSCSCFSNRLHFERKLMIAFSALTNNNLHLHKMTIYIFVIFPIRAFHSSYASIDNNHVSSVELVN